MPNPNFGWDQIGETLNLPGLLLGQGIVGPYLSPLGAGIIYYDKTDQRWKASENHGAPVNILFGGGSGSAYEFVQNGSTNLPQRNTINTGTTLVGTDDNTNHVTILNVLDNTSLQRIAVDADGTNVGTRSALNLISGNNITVSGMDNNGADRVDMTIDLTAPVTVVNGGTGTISPPTDGQLLIGKTDGTYAIANIIGGAGINVTNGNGSITLASAATPGKFSQDVGDGTNSTFTINHNLGTVDVLYQVHTVSDGTFVLVDGAVVDADNITLTFDGVPTSAQYRIVVFG